MVLHQACRMGRVSCIRTTAATNTVHTTVASFRTILMQHQQQHQQQQRNMVSSAQKRKLKKKGRIKGRGEGGATLPLGSDTASRASNHTSSAAERLQIFGVKPLIFFLGIFPVAMTGALVLIRPDLRQDINEKWARIVQYADDQDKKVQSQMEMETKPTPTPASRNITATPSV